MAVVSVGKRLRLLRKRYKTANGKPLSAYHMALLLGYNPYSYYALERSKKNGAKRRPQPSLLRLIDAIELFGIDWLEELYKQRKETLNARSGQ